MRFSISGMTKKVALCLVMTGTPAMAMTEFYFTLDDSATIAGTHTADSLPLSITKDDIVLFDGSKFSMFLDGTTAFGGLDLNGIHVVDTDTILYSFRNSGSHNLSGVTGARNEDVLEYKISTNTHSYLLDGSDVGIGDADEQIDALDILDDGSLIISTLQNNTLSGGFTTKDRDIVKFTPTTAGDYTAGTWSMYFDAGTSGGAGFTGSNDNTEAVAIDHDSGVRPDIYRSGLTGSNIPASGRSEDIAIFKPTTLHGAGDATTSGAFVSPLFFDGSAFGLSVNIDGISFVPDGGESNAVPVPMASWMGLSLLLGVGVFQKARHR